MFSNFIYFIIILLIYSTYPPAEKTNFTPFETISLFIVFIIIFICITWLQFQRIDKRTGVESAARLDHKFNTAVTRQSIMAIVLFAADIYVLNVPLFFSDLSVFSKIPTLEALLFITLFVLYLSVVWAFSHGLYQKLYKTDLSRRSYVISNISFSIPVILPWLLLSGIADIINLLPFELPKRLLSTTKGEVIYFIVFLVAVVSVGPVLIKTCWRCKPLEPGFIRERIENLCQRAGLKYTDILYWPVFGGRMITAGVMGLINKFRYILLTNALLNLLEPEEVDAVIAHEIGHIKKKHLLFYYLCRTDMQAHKPS